MYAKRHMPLPFALAWTLPLLCWMTVWSSAVVCAYVFGGLTWLAIPALPVTVLGTAVSFYLGFKGNAAYQRLWEARKIWGGIVNTSRTWGLHVTGFVQDNSAHEELLHRSVAWLAALRIRLRRQKPWEHIKPANDEYRRRFGTLDTSDARMAREMAPFLDDEETASVMAASNQATRLLHHQSQRLAQLHKSGAIDDFRHMELSKLLETMFTLQGKCERIKNFPLPRQYATANHWFALMFIHLVPFGILGAFGANPGWPVFLAIPLSVLLGWVFVMWDLVQDYSENPFEGLINDIPMSNMSATIEVDLREMLGESGAVAAIDHSHEAEGVAV